MNLVPIKYVGKRATYTDGSYGSYIEFKKGETQMVPEHLATKLLRHPDQYIEGDAGTDKTAVIQLEDKHKETSEDTQDTLDLIATMNAASLTKYAMTHYRIKLNKNADVNELRTEVTRLIDQFGFD